jgi:hypothetical protein
MSEHRFNTKALEGTKGSLSHASPTEDPSKSPVFRTRSLLPSDIDWSKFKVSDIQFYDDQLSPNSTPDVQIFPKAYTPHRSI